jgi:hypothetical protein
MPTTTNTSLLASDVMDRAAALLNDPKRTDYTYEAQLPYLNMAIDELVENLEESNSTPTNLTARLVIPIGMDRIFPLEGSGEAGVDTVYYPPDLVEIQEIGERTVGTEDPFVPMRRCEFLPTTPLNSSLLYWAWENQCIQFNRKGASTVREVELKYVRTSTLQVTSEHSIIPAINARSYLSYKTAALCSMFIGENETRATVLNAESEKALERLQGINNKGRQHIPTRHRPFRAGYKARGGF